MSRPVFVNGKAHLDYCYHCGANKEEVRHSQAVKDPMYCVLMGIATESGPAEAYAEFDRHRFVISEKAYNADIDAERKWFESHGAKFDEDYKIIYPWEEQSL